MTYGHTTKYGIEQRIVNSIFKKGKPVKTEQFKKVKQSRVF